MSRPLVAALVASLLLGAACSGSTSATAPADAPPAEAPPAEAPGEAAKPEAARPAEQEPEAANFADPKHSEDPPPPSAKPSTAEDPALAARIKEKFGADCRLERSCGDLLGIDCKSAVDGPYHYVERGDLKSVATCGGACMGGKCTDCPPKRWTCPTY